MRVKSLSLLLTIRYRVARTNYFSSKTKIPQINHFGLSRTTEKCLNELFRLLDITNMALGLEHNHLNRFALHLVAMVNEK